MIPRLSHQETLDPLCRAFIEELHRADFGGEVHTDFGQRLVAATDNSAFQIVPQAIIFPRSRDDIVAVARLAALPRFREVRFMPRGGGTGTNGGSLGTGICVDLSRYLNRILSLDLEAGVVRVEAGVVLDQLNHFLEPHGVFFAPHVATSDRATIGGMISNDSAGKGSRLYGRTRNHVESIDMVLADGTEWTTRNLDPAHPSPDLPPRVARALSVVSEILEQHGEEIERRFPKIDRYLTGYDLVHARAPLGVVDLASIVTGAEGTLGFVAGATLRLTSLPGCRGLVVAMYGSFDEALASASAMLAYEPSAIETIDDVVLGLARGDEVWSLVRGHFEAAVEVGALNLIELSDQTQEQLAPRLAALSASLRNGGALRVVVTRDESEAAGFWALRKRGAGLLANMPGDRRPVPFVEDCAVPPARLASFVGDLRSILDACGLDYGMYGHVDVGCLHVRPALDLRQPADAALLREISDRVFALVRSYGGVFWGEHGKGFRSEYNPEVFGPVLFPELCRIKAAFDPYDQMNPGKVATPVPGDELATIEAPLRAVRDGQIASSSQLRFNSALACNGNGACFSWHAHQPMCPSMRVSGDRVQSPKGRATILREWLRQATLAGWDGDVAAGRGKSLLAKWSARRRSSDDFSHEVYDAFAGCLSCKACVAQCPVHVDIPGFKAEFLHHYHQRYPRPVVDHLVARLETLLPRLSPWAAALNRLARSRPSRVLGEALLGVSEAPVLAGVTAEAGLRSLGAEILEWGALPDDLDGSGRVILLLDAFTNFIEPQVPVDAYRLFAALGKPMSVLRYRGSGKSLYVKGFLDEARAVFAANARDLSIYKGSGVEIVCVEPAIALLFRQEYGQVLGAAASGLEVRLPQEWLAANAAPSSSLGSAQSYTLLSHCTESTTAAAANELWRDVYARFGLKLEIPPVGCCGMAGSFGHEAAHVDDSRTIFSRSWEERVEQAGASTLVAGGYSCRSQVERCARVKIDHPLQPLLRQLST